MYKNQIRIMSKSNISVRPDCAFYIHHTTISTDFPLHRHEFFELDIVVSGHAKSNINGQIYDIGKNSILFFTPADFHDIILTTDEPLRTYNIAFPTSAIYREVWAHVPMSCHLATLSDESFHSAVLVCQHLLREYESASPPTELLMKTGIEWCLFLLAGAADTGHDKAHPTGDIAAALAYIYDNFTGEVSRDVAADIMHVSPMHFSRLFHRHMGVPFQEYLLNLRLDFAKKLLATAGTSVSEAAYASGFNSTSYFSRVFTRRYNLSPGQYAEAVAKKQ